MGKLSEEEIRNIIQKASLLQKFREQPSSVKLDTSNVEIRELYQITDDLGIDRTLVAEAYMEASGIPVQEAFSVDNGDINTAEIIGFAKGAIDDALLKELKAQIEYHFNTMGTIKHRRNKITWKAKPVGPSKLIAASNSPEVQFEQIDGNTKITAKQSLKTHNKFYLPAFASTFGAFMMIAYTIYFPMEIEFIPMLLAAGGILLVTFFYAKFVGKRKKKKKEDLKSLTETLQTKIERRLKSTAAEKSKPSNTSEIEIPEDTFEEENEAKSSKQRLKE